MIEHKLNYNWTLKDAVFTKDKGKVFSCFSCGGGSTMGYKLAGFDVIGNNEIDPKINAIYIKNHNPKYNFPESIETFALRNDLPDDLFNLDILDGSPPCSSFSMSGSRDKEWGKEKKFKEGQSKQVLDTLFFDFIALAKKLQPKVVVAENVEGILLGNAIKYSQKIYTEFEQSGYYCQHFILDSSKMGIPQKRKRVFFIALRKDLATKFLVPKNLFEEYPYIDMTFNDAVIPYSEIRNNEINKDYFITGNQILKYWKLTKPGNSFGSVHEKGSYFNEIKLHTNKVVPTLRASGLPYDYLEPRTIYKDELLKAGSYPQDYDFLDVKPNYLVGMSVPPLMTARIVLNIHNQWLSQCV